MKNLRVFAVTGFLLIPNILLADTIQSVSKLEMGSVYVVAKNGKNEKQSIPKSVLQKATCVAVFPQVTGSKNLATGHFGKGVVSCRSGLGWSNPVFVSLSGGHFGKFDVIETQDLVLVFSQQKTVERLQQGYLVLGRHTSVQTGVVGYTTEVLTEQMTRTEIYAYGHREGVFWGEELDSTTITVDLEANELVYGANGTSVLVEKNLKYEGDYHSVYSRALLAYMPRN